jgi:WD40 repeat protein
MRVFQVSFVRVHRVRFSPDSLSLAIVHRRSNRVAEVDLASGVTKPNRRFDRGELSAVAYSPDGGHLAVGTTTGFGQVVRRDDEEVLVNLDIGAGSAVEFANTSDPKRCWLAMAAAQFCLWNRYSQEYIVAEAEGDYRGASFGPDGSFVASIEHHAHCLTVWNVKPFRVLFRTALSGIGSFENGSVAVLPDGDRIVYAAGDQLRCVSMSGGPGWETDLKKPAIDLVLHPRGQSALIADGTKKVTQIDTTNGRPIQQFDWNIGKVSCVDIATDGTLAAAGGEKGQVVVWDAE